MWGRVLFGGFGSADEMVDDSNGDARSEDMVGQLGVGMILCRPFQLHDPASKEGEGLAKQNSDREPGKLTYVLPPSPMLVLRTPSAPMDIPIRSNSFVCPRFTFSEVSRSNSSFSEARSSLKSFVCPSNHDRRVLGVVILAAEGVSLDSWRI